MRRELAASDRGALAVHETVWLPDGRLLLALGEAGARLVTRDGRTAAHFDVPAHRIVAFDAGGHALLLAPRAAAWSIARVDLHARQWAPLGHLPLSDFAETTDGHLWMVANAGVISALDLHSPTLGALWRLETANEECLARDPRSLSLLVSTAEHRELWRYELPSLTLRVRKEIGSTPATHLTITSAGAVLGIAPDGRAWVQTGDEGATRPVSGTEPGERTISRGCGGWASIVTGRPGAAFWQLVDLHSGTVRWVTRFEQVPNQGRLRMTADVATWADSDGRAIAVDLGTGRVLRDLRVR
jgi:hypothetical protein